MKEPGANEELLSLIIVSHHCLDRPSQDFSSHHHRGRSWMFRRNWLWSEISCFETRISYTIVHAKSIVAILSTLNKRSICLGITRWLGRQHADRVCESLHHPSAERGKSVPCNRPRTLISEMRVMPGLQILWFLWPDNQSAIRITFGKNEPHNTLLFSKWAWWIPSACWACLLTSLRTWTERTLRWRKRGLKYLPIAWVGSSSTIWSRSP